MNDLVLSIEEIKQAATELFESEYLEVEFGAHVRSYGCAFLNAQL